MTVILALLAFFGWCALFAGVAAFFASPKVLAHPALDFDFDHREELALICSRSTTADLSHVLEQEREIDLLIADGRWSE